MHERHQRQGQRVGADVVECHPQPAARLLAVAASSADGSAAIARSVLSMTTRSRSWARSLHRQPGGRPEGNPAPVRVATGVRARRAASCIDAPLCSETLT